MNIHKTYIAIGMIVAFTLFFELAAHADEGDQATEITFSQPIQVPGQVLSAGTYLFQVNADDQNIVQIFSPDRMHLYATLQTIPTERKLVVPETTVSLIGQENGRPDLLVKWFYPGDETGHEFLYSKQLEKGVAHETQQTVIANQPTTNLEAGGSN
jgi:hypothetical protein